MATLAVDLINKIKTWEGFESFSGDNVEFLKDQSDALHPTQITVLMEAAVRGDEDVVHAIIDAGADVNFADKDTGCTALLHAIMGLEKASTEQRITKCKIALTLIESQADVNCVFTPPEYLRGEDGFRLTPLMSACIDGDVSLVMFLLKRGADPNISGADGVTAIFYVDSQKVSAKKIVEMLVDAKADLSVCNGRFLYGIVKDNDVRMLTHLQSAGIQREYIDSIVDSFREIERPRVSNISDDAISKIQSWEGFESFRGKNLNYTRKAPDFLYKVEQTVLMAAVEKGETEIVKELIKAGADVNFAEEETGKTPLLSLTEETPNKLAVVNELILAGANVNCRARSPEFLRDVDSGILTPLINACLEDDLELVQLLLKAGADPNVHGVDEMTAICLLGGSKNYVAIAKGLINAGAKLDAGHGKFIQEVLSSDKKEIIDLVVKGGFENSALFETNDFKDEISDMPGPKTPLMTYLNAHLKCVPARLLGQTDDEKMNEWWDFWETFSELLNKTEDINQKDAMGRSALFYALLLKPDDMAGLLVSGKIMIRSDIDVNLQDIAGNTPLIAYFDYLRSKKTGYEVNTLAKIAERFVEDLLIAGADISIKNQAGDSAESIMDELLKGSYCWMGVAAKIKNCKTIANRVYGEHEGHAGYTPLIFASCGGDWEKVAWLLKRGADINGRGFPKEWSSWGCPIAEGKSRWLSTALMWAKDITTVQLLLKEGADVNAKDYFGNTALIYFSSVAWVEGVRELLKAGANANFMNHKCITALQAANQDIARRRFNKIKAVRFVKKELPAGRPPLLEREWQAANLNRALKVIELLEPRTSNKFFPAILAPLSFLFLGGFDRLKIKRDQSEWWKNK